MTHRRQKRTYIFLMGILWDESILSGPFLWTLSFVPRVGRQGGIIKKARLTRAVKRVSALKTPTIPKLYMLSCLNEKICTKTIGMNSNGGRSGARWDMSPMPSPRPMPILPRSAVASSDYRPYHSSPKPSSLNVTMEPAQPKAARPPVLALTNNDQNNAGHSAASAPMSTITTVSSAGNHPGVGGIISTKA